MDPHGFDFQHSLNQAPPLEDYNSFTTHKALQNAVNAYGGGEINAQAGTFGSIMGSRAMQEAGILANKNTPVLKTHDRFGNRLDVVEFHPAYHQMMEVSIRYGVHSTAWVNGSYLGHAVLSYLKQQIDEGSSCPL